MRVFAAISSFAVVGTTLAIAPTAVAAPDGSNLVISEVYGGGGNSGATLTHDFIELYNPTDEAISVDGWSVQWRSQNGTGLASGVTPLTGSVPAGAHYLVQESQGAGGSQALPAPDASGNIQMGGKEGTAILANTTSKVDPGTDSFAGDPTVVDLVGVDSNVWEGSAAADAMNNTASSSRDADGTDTDDNAADFTTGAPTPEGTGGGVEPPEEVDATIPEIQGDGPVSPHNGDIATTQGVVTAAYPSGGLFGFYLQVPGTGGADYDPAQNPSSQAIFVRQTQPAGDVTVQPGDHVQVTGTVGEYAGATQLSVDSADDIETLPEAADPAEAVTAWPASAEEREALEGMLYRPTGDFTVTETYQTMHFGEVGLAQGDKPLIQWTDAARPDSDEADAIKADNALRGIVLDDGSSTNFDNNTDLTPSYISNDEPIRVGAKATFDQDVIFTEGGAPSSPTYRFQPLAPVVGPDNATSPATFENTRTDAPDESLINKDGDADVKVASFNVLNYFTTLGDADDDDEGDGGCQAYEDRDGDGNNVSGGCDQRGAWDPEDLQRQQTKIVKAINALDADVVGLMEIENSAALGEDADEATNTLVDALNADAGSEVWAANPSSTDLPPASEQDVITNAIIYKVASVERTGEAHALGDQSGNGEAFGNAREPIAQAFTAKAGGAPFLFVVNHFKSKGSAGPWPGDEDAGDGQGASNESRVRQAEALRDWLPDIQSETGADSVLLAGDFNSYAKEDPLKVFYDAGYADVEQKFDLGKWSYSYQGLSGSLDHILVNEAAAARSTGADIWNINAGEALALEYSRWNYGATDFHTDTPYRSSDHDPVVLGLTADAAPVDGEVTLNLLGVNDFHGRINENTVKWAGTVEELTEQGGADSTLMVGAGDLIGASEFASAVDGDQPTIDVMNALGLDASAVGNHEFDKGFDDLRDRVIGSDDAPNAQWDYLGANVYAKGTTDPVLPEYATFEVDGVTVAVVGAVTEETASLVSPAGIADIEFGNPVDAVNRVAGELSDGDDSNGEADVIIASFHAGASEGEPASTYEEEIAKGGEFAEMASLDPAVDVIFNGHTHQTYAWDAPIPGDEGNTRPILQTGQYADNVGQVELTVDAATGDVVSYESRNVARTDEADDVLVEKYPRVAQVKEVVDAAMAHAAEIGNQPVGEITADISRAKTPAGEEDRSAESTLGDLVGNALRDGLTSDFEADLGITNPGGLRTDLVYAGDTAKNPMNTDGVVTFAEANSVLPFVNNVWLVDLTGAQLKEVLEQQWQPDGSSRPFLALGLSDNVRVTQDPTKPRGERITSVIIDGQPLDPAATYSVSTFSFLATGGDNFTAFTDGTSRDTGLIDRELWMSYLEGHQPLSPDFARQQVVESGFPAAVTAGQDVSFELSNLDLTSHDSPANTEVRVFLTNGTESLPMGNFPVADGAATVEFTAPDDLEGSWTVGVVADPTYTQVGLPLPAVDTTLTAEADDAMPYGTKGLVVATLESENPSTGQVELLLGDKVVGTGMLASGTASIRVDSTKLQMGDNELTVSYSGDEQNNASETTVTVKVVKAEAALSTTLSTKKPVVKADSVVVTATLDPEGYTPTGYVVLYVDGLIRTLADLQDGTAQMGVTPFDTAGKHTVQVVYYGDDHTMVDITNTTVKVAKAKPKMTVKLKPKKVHAKKTRAKVVVALKAIGQTPRGKVRVKVAGKLYAKKLKATGKTTIKLRKLTKGKKKLVVKYMGNKLNKPVKKKVTLKVVK